MTAFTELEFAALDSIFSETPELMLPLKQQLAVASVIGRENSGCGFFTTMVVSPDARLVSGPRVLGHQTHARIVGLEHGLGFVLFLEDGRLHMLEAFAFESTGSIDLATATFEVYREPVQHAD